MDELLNSGSGRSGVAPAVVVGRVEVVDELLVLGRAGKALSTFSLLADTEPFRGAEEPPGAVVAVPVEVSCLSSRLCSTLSDCLYGGMGISMPNASRSAEWPSDRDGAVESIGGETRWPV